VHCFDRFDAISTIQKLLKYKCTALCAPPTAYKKLVLEDITVLRGLNLHDCVSAGEPLNPEVIRVWKDATNIIIREGYGQTETMLLCCIAPEMKAKYGSIGTASPHYTVEVLDDNLEICAPGVHGIIAVKKQPVHPIGLFEGYITLDDQNPNSCFQGDWYLTGDCAYKDDEGYFWFIGRNDDMIKSSGYRIGPFDVESAVMMHPAVAEVAAVASPHPIRGSIVKVFVVLKEEYKDKNQDDLVQSIKALCAKELPHYSAPSLVEFMDEFPKTVSGKIKRNELRASEENRNKSKL